MLKGIIRIIIQKMNLFHGSYDIVHVTAHLHVKIIFVVLYGMKAINYQHHFFFYK